MQPGPRRHLVVARAVVVAAAVVEIPVQGRRGVVVLREPLLERDLVERIEGRVQRRLHRREHKDALAVAAAQGAQAFDFSKKSLVLGQFLRLDAMRRDETVLPGAVEQQPFLRPVQHVAFVVVWLLGERVALDDAEVRQDLAHMHRFGRRQRQVVAAGRIRQLAEMASRRVPVWLRPVDHQRVAVPFPVQLPRRRQAGDAGAEDHHIGLDGAARRRQLAAVAQVVAFGAARIIHRWPDLLPALEAGPAGQRQPAGAGQRQERTPVHQRITRRQSCSNSRTSDCVLRRFGAMSMRCMSGGKANISRVVSAFR